MPNFLTPSSGQFPDPDALHVQERVDPRPVPARRDPKAEAPPKPPLREARGTHPALPALRKLEAAYAKVAAQLPKTDPTYKPLAILRAKVAVMIQKAEGDGSDGAGTTEAAMDAVVDDLLREFNLHHEPAGTSVGGRFAKRVGAAAAGAVSTARQAGAYVAKRVARLAHDETGSAELTNVATSATFTAALSAATAMTAFMEKNGIEDEKILNMIHLGEAALELVIEHWPEIAHTGTEIALMLSPFLEARAASVAAHSR